MRITRATTAKNTQKKRGRTVVDRLELLTSSWKPLLKIVVVHSRLVLRFRYFRLPLRVAGPRPESDCPPSGRGPWPRQRAVRRAGSRPSLGLAGAPAWLCSMSREPTTCSVSGPAPGPSVPRTQTVSAPDAYSQCPRRRSSVPQTQVVSSRTVSDYLTERHWRSWSNLK